MDNQNDIIVQKIKELNKIKPRQEWKNLTKVFLLSKMKEKQSIDESRHHSANLIGISLEYRALSKSASISDQEFNVFIDIEDTESLNTAIDMINKESQIDKQPKPGIE